MQADANGGSVACLQRIGNETQRWRSIPTGSDVTRTGNAVTFTLNPAIRLEYLSFDNRMYLSFKKRFCICYFEYSALITVKIIVTCNSYAVYLRSFCCTVQTVHCIILNIAFTLSGSRHQHVAQTGLEVDLWNSTLELYMLKTLVWKWKVTYKEGRGIGKEGTEEERPQGETSYIFTVRYKNPGRGPDYSFPLIKKVFFKTNH